MCFLHSSGTPFAPAISIALFYASHYRANVKNIVYSWVLLKDLFDMPDIVQRHSFGCLLGGAPNLSLLHSMFFLTFFGSVHVLSFPYVTTPLQWQVSFSFAHLKESENIRGQNIIAYKVNVVNVLN